MDHVSDLYICSAIPKVNLFCGNNDNVLATDEKYPEGWPRLASFLDGCSNFSIFRRFGHCATRILVNYTTRITMLEKELHDLDVSDSLPNGKRYRLRNLHEGSDRDKEKLLVSLEDHIRKYCMYCIPPFSYTQLSRAP